MSREFGDYIADMLDSAREVEEFTRGMDFEAFVADKKTVNAVIRSLEVMGEAAKRIPERVRDQYPDIPWKQMAGMRDKLIHEYSGVDLQIVWGVIRDELPPVRPRIEEAAQDFGIPL
ncbi:MAG: DUF86 domain-containing protein [Candidatus Brocadiia bacterium]|jgi:uncharacterized protein with HEPN domain